MAEHAFPGLNAEFVGISSDGDERYEVQPSGGMTLRDYFAGKAMDGFNKHIVDYGWGDDVLEAHARQAYRIADAMLKARDDDGGR